MVKPGSFFSTSLAVLPPVTTDGRDWLEELHRQAVEKELPQLARLIKSGSPQVQFVGTVMALAPFLRETFLNYPQFLEPLQTMMLSARLDVLLADIAVLDSQPEMTENRLMQHLRRLKREAHGLIALGDLGGIFTKGTSTVWLSRLAEAALGTALRFLLREAEKAGKISLKNPDTPEDGCGLIMLGMGKLGAGELNYSSDIDLVVFIDENSLSANMSDGYVDIFSRMIRRLVRIMQERTADGYVFRVDLRLRPDPGATPLALPVGAALRYYEGRGQNWERAALIKARAIAGDIAAGERFLQELSPYIWRKYLDYAAIADIHSIKRQIHTHKGYDAIAVRGHDVKLGRGGIREIEFFVQTQQLIAGGRFPQLRGRGTVEMLAALCTLGWITAEVRDTLAEKYIFLRDIEHRIQMIADEQSHTLPRDEEGFLRIVHLMRYRDDSSFLHDVLAALRAVEGHYAALFENEPDSEVAGGNLVFTGEDDDPETLATLSRLGFKRPADICRIIRTWHFGRYRATRSAEARERLTELTSALLQAFGATQRADEALVRFDAFLQGLPAGIQLFSLLQSNPALLDMLVLIMSTAPRLAEIIMRNPHVFDSMLDPATFAELPTRSYLEERLQSFLRQTDNYEETLDRLRIFAAEQRFLIGIRLLSGVIDGVRAGFAFTALADLMIAACLRVAEAEFIRHHGCVAGGKTAVLGMGKLGSHELAANSDVDIILLYDHDAGAEMSDGGKPLYVSQYYARLAQRLVAALSAPSGEGVLYKVDLRLRPSGNKGPVAVDFSAFGKYQRHDAWVWEHMALTRARVIAGDMAFQIQLAEEIRAIVALPRKKKKTARAVCKMRGLLEQEKPAGTPWDFKTMAGGIIDLEFMAQFAVLMAETGFVAGASTGEILARLPQNLFKDIESAGLVHGYRLYTNLDQIMRLCLNETFDPDDIPAGLSDLLLRTAGEPDMTRAKSLLEQAAHEIRQAFVSMIGRPEA